VVGAAADELGAEVVVAAALVVVAMLVVLVVLALALLELEIVLLELLVEAEVGLDEEELVTELLLVLLADEVGLEEDELVTELLVLVLADEVGLDEEELEIELLLTLELLALEVGLVVTVLMVVCEEAWEDVVPWWLELDGEEEVVGTFLPVVVVGWEGVLLVVETAADELELFPPFPPFPPFPAVTVTVTVSVRVWAGAQATVVDFECPPWITVTTLVGMAVT